MDISPEGLYRRLVIEGKGSFCFGLNGLFLEMIRGLGYRAYSSAGRINIGDAPVLNFLAFVHMVIFVQPIENDITTFLVDVSGNICRPILLRDGESVLGASPTEQHTLSRSHRIESSLETASNEEFSTEWRLTVHHNKPTGITSKVLYSFIEDEFFRTDYETANFAVAMSRGEDELFWNNVVCSKAFFLNEETGKPFQDRHMGRHTMEGNVVRRHVGPHSEVIRTMRMEEDRVLALKDIFQIEISDLDVHNICGRPPALL